MRASIVSALSPDLLACIHACVCARVPVRSRKRRQGQAQGPLDPLVAGLLHYTSNKDLQAKTHLLFQELPLAPPARDVLSNLYHQEYDVRRKWAQFWQILILHPQIWSRVGITKSISMQE